MTIIETEPVDLDVDVVYTERTESGIPIRKRTVYLALPFHVPSDEVGNARALVAMFYPYFERAGSIERCAAHPTGKGGFVVEVDVLLQPIGLNETEVQMSNGGKATSIQRQYRTSDGGDGSGGITVIVNPTPVTVENTVNIKDPVPTDAEIAFSRNPDGTIKSAHITEAE